jgi:hypothetical protein
MNLIKLFLIIVVTVISIKVIAGETLSVNIKPEANIDKVWKVLYLEIIEENWDSLKPDFNRLKAYKRNANYNLDITDLSKIGDCRFNITTRSLLLKEPSFRLKVYPKDFIYKGIANYFERNNGRGRIDVRGGAYRLFNLPYKIEYQENLHDKTYVELFEIKGMIKSSIEVISFNKDGTVIINYQDDNSKDIISLKPNESWESNVCKRTIKPKLYLPEYGRLSKEKPESMDLSNVIPEEVEFSSQMKIQNYGIVDMEIIKN